MRKLHPVLFLILYACIQTGMVAWDCYKPVVHFICYHFGQQPPRASKQVLIKTNVATYKNCRQDDQEILWQGSLYDIKKMTVTGNEVTVVAEKDNTENSWMELYNTIRQHIATDRTRQWPARLNGYRWLFKLYMPATGVKNAEMPAPAGTDWNRDITHCLPRYWIKVLYAPPDGC